MGGFSGVSVSVRVPYGRLTRTGVVFGVLQDYPYAYFPLRFLTSEKSAYTFFAVYITAVVFFRTNDECTFMCSCHLSGREIALFFGVCMMVNGVRLRKGHLLGAPYAALRTECP